METANRFLPVGYTIKRVMTYRIMRGDVWQSTALSAATALDKAIADKAKRDRVAIARAKISEAA